MTLPCDCCEGPKVLTPLATVNRGGLSSLAYRVGTYTTFLETMQARLSSQDHPELAALTTREPSDPAIALLDAWAIVADVLTFYQERIANEGYLRTATERRSILELARLIGYALRPGVAASVYLAYSLENDSLPGDIPPGARVNSVPGPGEQMQSFETSDALKARVAWNELKPRKTRPQVRTPASALKKGLYLQGATTNLKPNDPLLIVFPSTSEPVPFRVKDVTPNTTDDRTLVTLNSWSGGTGLDVVREIARRFSDTERFGVSRDTATAGRVLGLLTDLETRVAADDSADAVSELLASETLPKLAEEHHAAKVSGFAKLEPWLGSMITELKGAHERLSAAGSVSAPLKSTASTAGPSTFGGLLASLTLTASQPPANARRLERSVTSTFAPSADILPRLLTTLRPELGDVLYPALRKLAVSPKQDIEVYALRVTASLFGHNAPPQPQFDSETGRVIGYIQPDFWNTWNGLVPGLKPLPSIALDSRYDQLTSGSLVLIDRPVLKGDDGANDGDIGISETAPAGTERVQTLHQVSASQSATMAGLGVAAKVTQVTVRPPWLKELETKDGEQIRPLLSSTPFLRGTVVYAQSELLPLAEEPVDDDICSDPIELDGLYDGLEPGRWLIITGERTDVADTAVQAAELLMLAGVTQKVAQVDPSELGEEGTTPVDLPGDQLHTFLTLAQNQSMAATSTGAPRSTTLAYCYKRDTVTIYGNVVAATHGETRTEVLGSGDATTPFQRFTLKQPPLTWVSAPTPSGVASTLAARVNDVQWHDADTFVGLGPADRRFVTRTGDDDKTVVIFGNGRWGARLPTGQENVTATYRNGIGKPGNVKAGQISLLATRPLGVKGVTNPLRASGGADRESGNQARQNAPFAVMALDRLVSVQDHADFARTFAGVGKAAAAIPVGGPRIVRVTIAGADDIPIDTTSDLFRNLLSALHRFGDPHLPVRLDVRERLALVISAWVHLEPDYVWESMEPKIRAALLDRFSFARRDLAQDALLSDAMSAAQAVPGVAWVDVDVFDVVSEANLANGLANALPALVLNQRVHAEPARFDQGKPLPAQLVYLAPEVPETLILQERTS